METLRRRVWLIEGHEKGRRTTAFGLQLCCYVFMMLRPARRFAIRPLPPGDFAARFLAAVILPPLDFLVMLVPI
jgi:hypothetical protein